MRAKRVKVSLRALLLGSLLAGSLTWIQAPAAQAADKSFTWNLTSGTPLTAQQQTDWANFKTSLTGSYGSFYFGGTNGSITVTDSVKVQNIVNGMKTNTTVAETIGSNTWRYYYAGTSQEEFGNQVSWSCSATAPLFEIRPTIGTGQWGGITLSGPADSCYPVTQTITLTFFENAPVATTFSSSQTSPTNITTAGVITYSLIMSQSVTGLAAADFQFGGSSSCNTPGVTGSGTTYSVTVTNCTEGNLILQLKANSVTGSTTTGPSAIASSNTIIIDRTLPTIGAPTTIANGTYGPTTNINLTFTTSETVTVSGSPRVPITIGSTLRYATYLSGSNSRTLVFRYVVAADLNDIDTDGIAITSPLQPNSGSIVDLATNAMASFTFTPPNTTALLIAQRPGAPTITGITPGNAQLVVAFNAGVANGAAITNYKYSTNGSAFTSAGTTTSPFTITGLANGTTYAVRILAVNSIGDGDSSTAVSATPSTVVVGGGSNISWVFGSTTSSSAFTANGGAAPYTFSLSNSTAGISIDSATGVVTAANSLSVGSYAFNVIATDSFATPRVGTKAMTINITQETPTITIALTNNATDAPLGGVTVITATLSQAGVVTFKVGVLTIAGCGSVNSSAGTASCNWTPAALGNATLTAVLVPTDSTNYASSTSVGLIISVANGITSIALSLPGGATTAPKGQSILITATIDQVGLITFLVDGKRIPGCFKLLAVGSSRTCAWKPAVQKAVNLTARLTPTNVAYNVSTAALKVQVLRRTGTR